MNAPNRRRARWTYWLSIILSMLAGFAADCELPAQGAELVTPFDDDRWQQRHIDDSARDWWAFRPLNDVTPLQTPGDRWSRTDVDRFILARLDEQGLTPSGPAVRHRLIRRAYLDLLGIPPTPEQIAAFVNDPSDDAYEKLIDQLLNSPHYGERWARHWLDVARFAESHGFEQDYDRPNAYHYRDFVIKALNADMPFDQFVRWQIAGDELAPDEPLAWMATGFLGAGVFPTQLTEAEFERARYDELDDMAATTGAAFLGVSIGCARCHDHKFDPIPQADYYRFVATFTTAIRSEVEIDLRTNPQKRTHHQWQDAHRALMAEYEAAKATNEKSDRAEQFKKLIDEHKKLEPEGLTKVMVVREGIKPLKHHADGRGFPHFYPKTHFLARGDTNRKEGEATQAFLQALTEPDAELAHWRLATPDDASTPLRRAALARWITDTEHGPGQLLARVIVNRLWHHHFGKGIVTTPNDFGRMGTLPTHPQLLDWLANELIENGWRLKPIHKLMMTSAVYRQSAEFDDADAAMDPENQFLWRSRVRRLEAEALRDSMLAVSGLLDRTMFGPGTLDESMTRRSIYFFQKRSKLIPTMQLFDSPEPLVSQGSRPTTTTAPAALFFMNSELGRRCAAALAKRVAGDDARIDFSAAIDRGYMIALGREPTSAERKRATQFLIQQAESYARVSVEAREADDTTSPQLLALTDFAQTLLGLNEFAYLE